MLKKTFAAVTITGLTLALSGCAMNVKLPVAQTSTPAASNAPTDRAIAVGPANYVKLSVTENFDRSKYWDSNQFPYFSVNHDPWGAAGTIVATLDAYVAGVEANFKKLNMQAWRQNNPERGFGYVHIQPTITSSTPELLTIDIATDVMLPGDAHPDNRLETFAFNPQSGERVTLVDSLTPQGFAQLQREALTQLKETYAGQIDSADMVRQALADPANWQAWQLQGDLQLTLPIYAVGDRALGMPTIYLQYDKVLAALQSDSAIHRALSAE